MAVNCDGPWRLYQNLSREAQQKSLVGVRFVTFGSVLERNATLAKANPYLASRRRLWLKWRQSKTALSAVEWHHFQLHTLYGGERLHPFLFLGQMEHALRRGLPFHMSGGMQIREYHHVDDIVLSVGGYLRGAPPGSDCVHLSSGKPISLRSLSESVFAAFGASHLLKVGAVSYTHLTLPTTPYV